MKVPTVSEGWRSWRQALFCTMWARQHSTLQSTGSARLKAPLGALILRTGSGNVQHGFKLPQMCPLPSHPWLLTNVVTTLISYPHNLPLGSLKTQAVPLPWVLPLLCISKGKGSSWSHLCHTLQRSVGSSSHPPGLLCTLLTVASDLSLQYVPHSTALAWHRACQSK